MQDPYVYNGSKTLINKHDILDAQKLEDLEAAFYRVRLAEPLPSGHFDYAHLKRIHKHLFGDIYEWAGHERTVDIVKGDSHFARKEFIKSALEKIFIKLETDNYLENLAQIEFCKKLAYYFNEINAAHPFREGNGRTLRAFCDLLAEKAGYRLDWGKITPNDFIQANIEGFKGNDQATEMLLQKIVSCVQ